MCLKFFKIRYFNIINQISFNFFINTELPHLKSLIKLDDVKSPGYFNFSELYDYHDSSHFLELEKRLNEIDPDDPINIQFTSGK